MNRIDNTFQKLKEQNKKAFITFVAAGDPDLDTTKRLILEMGRNGVDMVELGVPFTDPMAEGIVIQKANLRALEHGVCLEDIMDMVKELRKETQIPLIYLMYYNSILSFGVEKFFDQCKEVGIDAVIIPDLPIEESDEIAPYAEKTGVYHISMVAPTSEERLQMVTENAKGFVYCVSSMGVTGMREQITTNLKRYFEPINRICHLPKCLGFGISTPEQASLVKQYCDGLIVGSAIVNQIGLHDTPDEKVKAVGDLVRSLREAI